MLACDLESRVTDSLGVERSGGYHLPKNEPVQNILAQGDETPATKKAELQSRRFWCNANKARRCSLSGSFLLTLRSR